MPSLGLLWLVLFADVLLPVAHAVQLQESLPEIVQGRFRRAPAAPRKKCEDNGDQQGGMVTLYHYTDEAGFEGIMNTGYIKEARPFKRKGDDSQYGKGVYFTALGPDRSDRELAQNNWVGPTSWYTNKLKYYIECRIARNEVCHAKKAVAKRKDIWVVEGDKFQLEKGNCTGEKRKRPI